MQCLKSCCYCEYLNSNSQIFDFMNNVLFDCCIDICYWTQCLRSSCYSEYLYSHSRIFNFTNNDNKKVHSNQQTKCCLNYYFAPGPHKYVDKRAVMVWGGWNGAVNDQYTHNNQHQFRWKCRYDTGRVTSALFGISSWIRVKNSQGNLLWSNWWGEVPQRAASGDCSSR